MKDATFLKSLIPPILLVGIQFASSIIVSSWGTIYFLFANHFDSSNEFYKKLYDFSIDMSGSEWIFLMYAIVGIIAMSVWMRCLSKERRASFKLKALSGWMVPVLVLMAASFQIVTEYLQNFTIVILPEAGNKYIELMESAGLSGEVSAVMVLYACILGPIVEELCFRGLCFRFAREKLPFWIANVMQALMFGFFHMNLVQGIYTFALGLLLGYLVEKTGNLLVPIVLHILYNSVSGVLGIFPEDAVNNLINMIYSNALTFGTTLLISMLLAYVSVLLFNKIVSSWKGQTIDKIIE